MNIYSQNTSCPNILLTRFPLESAWGGEEEIHLLMAQIIREHGGKIQLLTSCPHLSKAFQQKGFSVYTEYQKDITSRKQLLWSIVTAPFFFLRGLFLLPYFRWRNKTRTVLFLTFIEKVLWTPIALLLGMKVFWGHHAPLGDWFFKNPYLFLWKWWSGKVKIIVASSFMKGQLEPYTKDTKRIHIIPNTLTKNINFDQKGDIPLPELEKLIHTKAAKKYNLQEKYIVMTASRLSPEKGMQDVVAVAEMLQDTNPNILFLCAGTGSEHGMLQKSVQEKQLKNIHFLGFLSEEELAVVYENANLFLLPSHREPFGMVLLEAMAAKKPVVAADTGGVPDVLGSSNEGLYECKNTQRLKEKILYFHDNPEKANKIVQKNTEHFYKYFTPSVFQKNIVNIFCAQK